MTLDELELVIEEKNLDQSTTEEKHNELSVLFSTIQLLKAPS